VRVELRTKNLSVLLLIVISTACSCSAKSRAEELPKDSTGVLLVSDKSTGTILVDAKLNGEPVVMILDTGASHSMFDASTFGLSAVQFQAARMNTHGLGLNADVVLRTANFELGNKAWKQQPVEIADLHLLSKIYGRKIGGIIGQDVLRSFASVQINYKGQCVMFYR
jgi:predicted aspartyl protease